MTMDVKVLTRIKFWNIKYYKKITKRLRTQLCAFVGEICFPVADERIRVSCDIWLALVHEVIELIHMGHSHHHN